MWRFLLTSVLFASSSLVSAQSLQDVVYLNNGSVIKGTIIQNDTILKVQVLGGSIFAYRPDEVLSVAQEKYERINFKGPITIQPNGWFAEFSFGVPFGTSRGWPVAGSTLNAAVSYQFNQILKAGLGSGIDWYAWDATIVPIYARLSGDLTKSKTTPFYNIDLGYGANITQTWDQQVDYNGGFLMYVAAGFKFNTRKRVFYNFSFGYKTQFTSSYHFQPWLEEPFWEYRQFNRIETRVAIGF